MPVHSVASSPRQQGLKKMEKPEQTRSQPVKAVAERKALAPSLQDRFEAGRVRPMSMTLSAAERRADIDPRVAARLQVGASPVQGNGQGQLVVDTVAFQPPGQGPGESQGRHNVYVRIEGPDGKPLPREQVEKYFIVEYVPAAGNPAFTASGKFGDGAGVKDGEWAPGGAGGAPTDAYFAVDLHKGYAAEVWVRPNPQVQDNPYAGYGSQKVGPFTLQLGNPAEGTNAEHVNYLVTFQMEPGAAAQQPALQPQEPAPQPQEPVGVTPPVAPVEPQPAGAAYAPGDTLRVTVLDGANIRDDARIEGNRVGGAVYDARLTVTEPPGGGAAVRGNWVHVRTPSGTEGWVNTGLVEPASAAPAPTPPVEPGPVGQVPVPLPAGAPGSPFHEPYEVVPGLSVNGRLGAHWPTAFRPSNPEDMAQVGAIINNLKSLGAGYTTLSVSPGDVEAMKPVFQALHEAGITPVVRLYKEGSPDGWSDADLNEMANAAVKLGEAGVHFVQIGNEPNIETSLNGSEPDKAARLQASVQRQVDAIVAVQRRLDEAGQSGTVKVGLTPMAAGSSDGAPTAWSPDTYYKALLEEVARREASMQPPRRLVDWIATHTYVYEDGIEKGMAPGSGGARGQMGWGPDTARWYEAWAANILGYAPRSLSTEAGAVPNSFREGDTQRVAREIQTTVDQLRSNSNTTACLWLDWESQPGSNTWDRSVLDPRDGGDMFWSEALPPLREEAARAG